MQGTGFFVKRFFVSSTLFCLKTIVFRHLFSCHFIHLIASRIISHLCFLTHTPSLVYWKSKDLLVLDLFLLGDSLRILPWDSSPFFHHHSGEPRPQDMHKLWYVLLKVMPWVSHIPVRNTDIKDVVGWTRTRVDVEAEMASRLKKKVTFVSNWATCQWKFKVL